MKVKRNFYKFLPLVLLAFALSSCADLLDRPPRDEESGQAEEPGWQEPRGVEPLELAEDRDIIPRLRPQDGAIVGVDQDATGDSPSVGPNETRPEAPTIGLPEGESNQVFRVQLFTSKLFGEAKRATLVAEEIFDQPVATDYEVPYFKVRVGEFVTRDAAEDYLQKVKAAGYSSAFVVLATVNVQEAEPLYEDLPTDMPADSLTTPGPDKD